MFYTRSADRIVRYHAAMYSLLNYTAVLVRSVLTALPPKGCLLVL